MEKNLKSLFFIGFTIILLCAANNFAQVKVGGYKSVPTDDQAVIDAAEFAANTQSDRSNTTINIESIEKAERQVVAGTNYRICMQVAVGEEGEEKPSVQFIQAIVFQSLQQEYDLKSWTKVKSCA